MTSDNFNYTNIIKDSNYYSNYIISTLLKSETFEIQKDIFMILNGVDDDKNSISTSSYINSLMYYTEIYNTPYKINISEYNEILNNKRNPNQNPPLFSLLDSYICYNNCINIYSFGFNKNYINHCNKITIPENIINNVMNYEKYRLDIIKFLKDNNIKVACVPTNSNNKIIYYMSEEYMLNQLSDYLHTQNKLSILTEILDDNNRSVIKKLVDYINVFKPYTEDKFIYNIDYMICIPINIVEKDYNYNKRFNPIISNTYLSSLYKKRNIVNINSNYISSVIYDNQETQETLHNQVTQETLHNQEKEEIDETEDKQEKEEETEEKEEKEEKEETEETEETEEKEEKEQSIIQCMLL